MNELEEKIKQIKDLVDIQGTEGNWDYNEYMLGMYNGMELVLSVLENRNPIYI